MPAISIEPEPAAADRRLARIAWLSAVAAPLVLLGLFVFDVPLGQPGKFTYLYSPYELQRLSAAPGATLWTVALAGGIWLCAAERRGARMGGMALVSGSWIGLGAWAHTAPPSYQGQHLFNMNSPSQDGAFALEAMVLKTAGMRSYLAGFPQRARQPEEKMRGTRVISNPPGATLLAYGADQLLEHSRLFARLVLATFDHSKMDDRMRSNAAFGLAYAWLLTAVWISSGVFLYLLGRVVLPPVGAAALASCALLTPATFMFSPGKDPAQLLTVAAPACAWLWATRRDAPWAALLAGALAIGALVVGLAHGWVALIVFLASPLLATNLRAFLLRQCLPAALGAAAAILALRWLLDFDLIATLRAVAASQAIVTRGPDAMPLAWQALGAPLFLLFAGPAFWCAILWPAVGGERGSERAPGGVSEPGGDRRAGDRRRIDGASQRSEPQLARFGAVLLGLTLLVLLGTVGFTNVETPRLWIPFYPLLLLGGAALTPQFTRPDRAAAALLATLVVCQLVSATAQWTLMDAREAETRMTPGEHAPARMFH
jgi:hypothetical protein